MNAALLTIGNELLRGDVADRNALWVEERLRASGVDLRELRTVGDDRAAIVAALEGLTKEAEVLIVTGGLGSTSDDLTRDAVADALGVELGLSAAELDRITARWRDLGRQMPAANRRQAMIPQSARILANSVGSAPGFAFELSGATVYCVPGVPAEARAMIAEHILPELVSRGRPKLAWRRMRVAGLAESEVAAHAEGAELPEGVVIRYRAELGDVVVTVESEADDELVASSRAREVATELRARLGDSVYAEGEQTLPAVIGQHLRDRSLTLALAESCTGGAVGASLTDIPGSSAFLLLDAVVYANSAKEKILGVRTETLRGYGAVSAEVAAAMAEGAMGVADADLGLSITGIAGPTGGTDEKPVGTVFMGLARRGQPTIARHAFLPGDRDRIRRYATFLSLDLLRRAVLGLELQNAYMREIA